MVTLALSSSRRPSRRVSKELEHFQKYLKSQGQKLTQQRELILQRVLKVEEHFSAEELFELTLERGASRALRAPDEALGDLRRAREDAPAANG